MSARIYQLALRVQIEIAAADIALAIRRLHREEALAVERKIERRFGALERSLAEILNRGAIDHEGYPPVVAREIFVARGRVEKLLEHHRLRLEAGGVDVRDIVRNHVEFAPERDLP
jgi:hypothetical protein